jgi:hypothetical protein
MMRNIVVIGHWEKAIFFKKILRQPHLASIMKEQGIIGGVLIMVGGISK